MTARERIAALAAAVVIAGLGRALLRTPSAVPPRVTPLTWCLPEENPAHHWARVRWKPPHALRAMLVARDAVTGERLNAALAARPIDSSFAQVSGGDEAAFWDLPPGGELVFSASTVHHYSSSGYRKLPDLPGAALAMTVWLLTRPSPIAGTVEPGDGVRLRRPVPAGEVWGFVDRLRQSGLASAGLDEAWTQVFASPVVVQPDGNWTHSAFPGLPIVVEHTAHGERTVPRRYRSLIPIRDLNRVGPGEPAAGSGTAGAAVAMPAYPRQWPPAQVALTAVASNGKRLEATVRVRGMAGAGAAAREVAHGLGSLRFALPARRDLELEVSAPGYTPRTVALRLQPSDRLWVPTLKLEPAE
ncbi:MAG: hypothetical protein ACYTGX_16125 [Planctomycetota bacterium]|jgi:hypothetical protein